MTTRQRSRRASARSRVPPLLPLVPLRVASPNFLPAFVASTGDVDASIDAPMRGPVGRAAGFDIFVVDRQIARPPLADQRAIGEFMGLMYTRAPKVEAMMRAQAGAFISGIRDAARAISQGPSAESEAWLREEQEEGAR